MKPLLIIGLLALSGSLWSADETRESPSVGTNVIGTQEAPTVLNVVPWKDKEVKLEKKETQQGLFFLR